MALPKGNDVRPFFFGKWVAFEHSLFQRGLVGIDAGVGVFQDGGTAERTNGGGRLGVRTGEAGSPIPSPKGTWAAQATVCLPAWLRGAAEVGDVYPLIESRHPNHAEM